MKHSNILLVAAMATLSTLAQAQQPPAGAPPGAAPGGMGAGERDMGAAGPQAPASTYQVDIHMQASSAIYKKWPSGGITWHYGKGYIGPFGGAEYYCGQDFPEAKNYPLTDSLKGFFEKFTGRGDALFCVYRTKDGDFYVYDSVTGSLSQSDGANGGRNTMINVVVDGSGAYKGATGIWMGLTEGSGAMTEVTQGRRLPEVLLKVMEGYVKVPAAKK